MGLRDTFIVGAEHIIAGVNHGIAGERHNVEGVKHWIDGSKRAQPAHGRRDANNLGSSQEARGVLPPVPADDFRRLAEPVQRFATLMVKRLLYRVRGGACWSIDEPQSGRKRG
jgi:hypothetical protein